MSKIDELIEKLCPDGVEYKRLENLCGTITTGKLNANAMNENGIYPFFTCDSKPFKINKYAFDEEAILISGNGSKVGHINYYKGKFNAYQRTYVLYNFKKIDVRFLLHYLKGRLKEYILVHCKKGSVPYITLPMLQNFSLPVPPLEIQEEIVRKLDDFTEISTEFLETLSTELQARQKQYEYYNQMIWNKVKDCEKIQLSLLCNIGDGLHGTPTYSEGTKLWFINGNNLENGKIVINDNTKEVSKDSFEKNLINLKSKDILLSINGTIGKIAYYSGEKIILGKSTAYFTNIDNNKILNEYLYYYLQSQDALKYYEASKTGSTIKNLGLKALREYKIPIPSLEEQEKIVNILDRLDKSYNDISESLPDEIEARQKQYEYYRDKLLTFKELKVEN